MYTEHRKGCTTAQHSGTLLSPSHTFKRDVTSARDPESLVHIRAVCENLKDAP